MIVQTLTAIQAWSNAHQALVALFVWPALSAFITWVFRTHSESDYASLPKPLAYVLRLISAGGTNSTAVLAVLGKLLGQTPPPAPPSTDPEGVRK